MCQESFLRVLKITFRSLITQILKKITQISEISGFFGNLSNFSWNWNSIYIRLTLGKNFLEPYLPKSSLSVQCQGIGTGYAFYLFHQSSIKSWIEESEWDYSASFSESPWRLFSWSNGNSRRTIFQLNIRPFFSAKNKPPLPSLLSFLAGKFAAAIKIAHLCSPESSISGLSNLSLFLKF
jgi:hypothetical protein